MIPYFMDIYWIILNRDYTYYEDNCYGYVMPRERSIDIDSKMDFMIADMHIKKNYRFRKVLLPNYFEIN